MTVFGPARAALLLVGAVLLAPTLAMGLQSTEALESFHNRTLAALPSVGLFWRDPARYFAGLNGWLADRVYPIIAATDGTNQIAYSVLGASPAANVTVGRDGLVFLNGTAAEAENDLVKESCLEAAKPEVRAALEAALARFAAYGRSRNLPIDVVMFPTVPVLYGDRLPRAFPPALRHACAAGPAGRPPLDAVRAPAGFHFLHPFGALEALRDDPAMYPLGDFHPDGLSVELVTESYLKALGVAAPRRAMTPTTGPAEVLAERGVASSYPLYAVAPSGAVADGAASASITAAVQPFYREPTDAYVYRDAAAPDPRAVLMLSDSFGINQGFSFAAAFRTVVQMPTPSRDPAALLDAVGAIVPFDRLIVVVNDTNSIRVVDLATRLAAGS